MIDSLMQKKQSNLVVLLQALFAGNEPPPTISELTDAAKSFALRKGYEGDIESVVEEVWQSLCLEVGLGESLIDTTQKHNENWVAEELPDCDWTYTRAYAKYLAKERWSPTVVNNLRDVSENILGLLSNPASHGCWRRRGLVIGHVQSGKTANYLGVVTRAADAGYKFIVIIAGIHNNLRRQTQERVELGFVGKTSDPNGSRAKIGVGLEYPDFPHPVTLTNLNDDFKKATASTSGWEINDFSKPIVIVIKKNVSTLNSLYNWLKELNAKGSSTISNVPMLMIDDEADNASINTNKPDLDPTQTNFMLRMILQLFEKSCYVGYTATPFANVLINHEAYDEKAKEELFPKDFIYCLDAPTSYFGPQKVFLDEDFSPKVLRRIEDAKHILPLDHKRDHDLVNLPESMYEAINEFVITCVIRQLKGQQNKHSSMMINVSRFVDIQFTVRGFVQEYIDKLRQAIKANHKLEEEYSSRNQFMCSLKNTFESEYLELGFDWQEIKKRLNVPFLSLKIVVVNSKSQDRLNYSDYPHGLNAIAIGGLSLSRGLTIEGLCVSYMYRNTRMYDTLMQMGRWFGYRFGYEEACRIHLTDESIKWYGYIGDAAEVLRSQIKEMRRAGLSPVDFGLYINKHPDNLLVTAANKMRHGETIILEQNYSGTIQEMSVITADMATHDRNERLIRKYWKEGFGKGGECVLPCGKGWFISDVAVDKVFDFGYAFEVDKKIHWKKQAALDYLRLISESFERADVLLVSLKDKVATSDQFGLGAQDRTAKYIEEENTWYINSYRVASKGDEKLGLEKEQVDAAKDFAETQNRDVIDLDYRLQRQKPLLMIHMLAIRKSKDSEISIMAPTFGISFPSGDYGKSVEVVANRVWLQSEMGFMDNPDEEDDYDD